MPSPRPPASIKKWNLWLQEYHFYTQKVKTTVPTFVSTSRSRGISDANEQSAERYAILIATHSMAKALTLNEIKTKPSRIRNLNTCRIDP